MYYWKDIRKDALQFDGKHHDVAVGGTDFFQRWHPSFRVMLPRLGLERVQTLELRCLAAGALRVFIGGTRSSI